MKPADKLDVDVESAPKVPAFIEFLHRFGSRPHQTARQLGILIDEFRSLDPRREQGCTNDQAAQFDHELARLVAIHAEVAYEGDWDDPMRDLRNALIDNGIESRSW